MITRYRKKRKVYFVLLVACICIMSVGFAAFASELTISSSAIVRPDSSAFKVVFSSSGTEFLTEQITASVVGDAKGGRATINNTGTTPTISDLTATFTEPGQSVKYEFYVYNMGAYNAYLTGIEFKNVDSNNTSKVCSAIDSNSITNSLMQSACDDISINVEIGNMTAVLSATTGISKHVLNKGMYEKVLVTISYSDNEHRADGDFKVEFGDIGLTYSTVDSPELISFTYDGKSYQAESGMTWGEWINSEYSPDDVSVSGCDVLYPFLNSNPVYDGENYMNVDSVIIEGYEYTIGPEGLWPNLLCKPS